MEGTRSWESTREEDPRNAIMGEFMRLVTEIKPRFFVMENVPGVPAERKDKVISTGKKAGYEISSVYLNAAEYRSSPNPEEVDRGRHSRERVDSPRPEIRYNSPAGLHRNKRKLGSHAEWSGNSRNSHKSNR